VDLKPGGEASFGWESERYRAVVIEVDPPRRFVYRWCLDLETPVDQGSTTTVEFTLEPIEGGTRLHLVESGFASLPEGVRDRHLTDNIKGWNDAFADLTTYVGTEAEV
jgi:uncharacterized protein YndB with AHSA1/START domain